MEVYDYDWTDEEIQRFFRKTPEPVLLSQIQTKIDLRGLMHYAKEKGKKECHLLRNSLHFKEESVTLLNDNTMT